MSPQALEPRVQEASTLLKAMSNEKRLLILCHLLKDELSVGTLEKLVNLSQSALSQHLARLRRDGFVQTRREAQTIFYSIKGEQTKTIIAALSNIFANDELSLAA